MAAVRVLLCAALAARVVAAAGERREGLHPRDFVAHFEVHRLEPRPQPDQHRERRRDAAGGGYVAAAVGFEVPCKGERLAVRLRPDLQLFHPEAAFVVARGGVETSLNAAINRSHFLAGHAVGRDGSAARFHYAPGAGQAPHGVVYFPASHRLVHVEPAARYFPAAHPMDAVVFEAADVFHNTTGPGACGRQGGSGGGGAGATPYDRIRALQAAMTATSPSPNPPPQAQRARRRRGAMAACTRCVCALALTCDPEFLVGPKARGDPATAISIMVNQLSSVNAIYENTPFVVNGEGALGYRFSVKRVKVYADAASSPVTGTSGADSYLEAFSNNGDDWSEFCLAHIFSHRDFDDGILGLAFVGSPNGGGGLCDKSQYNTGFTTDQNFGRAVADAVTLVTFAHELGHNMGSPHDPTDAQCSPGGSNGNFIMYPQATDGRLPNNNRFSDCSRTSIGATLAAKADGCFDETAQQCGNGIVEAPEPCDCGEACATDPCCMAGCQLREAAECSPQDPVRFPCCSSQCTNITAAMGVTCQDATDCTELSTCAGEATCPPAVVRDDNTPCNCRSSNCTRFPTTASKLCSAGACSRTVCDLSNATICSLAGIDSCVLACEGGNWSAPGVCISSQERGFGRLELGSGSPCENYKGYCDQNGICVTVDSDDLLKELSDFLDGLSAKGALKWMKANWPYLAGAVAGCLVLAAMLKLTYRPNRRRGYAALTNENLPMDATRPRVKTIHKKQFYHEGLSRDDAEVLLKDARQNGSFLVWDEPSRHGYVLSTTFSGEVMHVHIAIDNAGNIHPRSDPSLIAGTLDELINRLRAHGEGLIPGTLSSPISFGLLKGKRPLAK